MIKISVIASSRARCRTRTPAFSEESQDTLEFFPTAADLAQFAPCHDQSGCTSFAAKRLRCSLAGNPRPQAHLVLSGGILPPPHRSRGGISVLHPLAIWAIQAHLYGSILTGNSRSLYSPTAPGLTAPIMRSNRCVRRFHDAVILALEKCNDDRACRIPRYL